VVVGPVGKWGAHENPGQRASGIGENSLQVLLSVSEAFFERLLTIFEVLLTINVKR
jgi:hypothetical protein